MVRINFQLSPCVLSTLEGAAAHADPSPPSEDYSYEHLLHPCFTIEAALANEEHKQGYCTDKKCEMGDVTKQ